MIVIHVITPLLLSTYSATAWWTHPIKCIFMLILKLNLIKIVRFERFEIWESCVCFVGFFF